MLFSVTDGVHAISFSSDVHMRAERTCSGFSVCGFSRYQRAITSRSMLGKLHSHCQITCLLVIKLRMGHHGGKIIICNFHQRLQRPFNSNCGRRVPQVPHSVVLEMQGAAPNHGATELACRVRWER